MCSSLKQYIMDRNIIFVRLVRVKKKLKNKNEHVNLKSNRVRNESSHVNKAVVK